MSADPAPALGARGFSAAPVPVDMELVRVASAGEAELVTPPGSNYSSFNLDSTRFLIRRGGRTALYSFSPDTLAFSHEGPLFDRFEMEGCHWSALDADTVFGVVSNEVTQQPQIFSYDLKKRSYTLVKDFSAVLPGGLVGGFSKARNNDDRLAFAWRESNLAPWHYLVVWDRSSDAVHLFDLSDPVAGVSGYRDAYLNESGTALVVRGEVTRLWDYMFLPQESALWADSTVGSGRIISKARPESDLDTSSELWNSESPRHFSFGRAESSSSVWDVLPFQAGNQSRDRHFFIFSGGNSASEVFIAAAMAVPQEAIAGVEWNNTVNCSATDNAVEKTGGQDDVEDAGAMTLESVESGDGFVQFSASGQIAVRTCGFLSTIVSPPRTSDFDYAIKFSSNKRAYAYEKGVVKAKIKYKPKNTFRIAIEGEVVKYYKNNAVFYTSGLAPSYPLFGAASLASSSASVTRVMMSGGQKVSRVKVNPNRATLSEGSSQKFSATVTGTKNTTVGWSASAGSITSDGTYTAPFMPGQFTVTATTVTSPTSSGSAAVEVIDSDTTPPLISSVSASGITASGAFITWTTDEASDSQVDYGTNTLYGASTPLDSSLLTSHSASLSGLSASTVYHFSVKSRDAAGNLATSSDFTFTTGTAADTEAPVISAVASSNITSSGATITWSTNEGSDTQVDYGTTTSYGSSTSLNSTLVTSHSASLSGLSASTQIHYRVKSRDAAGNLATSADFTFTTGAAADTEAPVISGVASSNITSSGATITWSTNEGSDTQVEYGTTTSYGSSTALNSTLVTSHSGSLSSLSASTLYHYRVKSRDAAGNLATSADFTFTTAAAADTAPPVISGVASSAITSSGATITWSTNEASDTQVEYGTTTSYGSSTALDSTLVTSHSASLSGLSASTLYHYRVKSRDAAGNLATSADFTFTTGAAADTTAPVISGVASSNITSSGATITWSTNEASDSQVDYGTSASYGSSTGLSSSMVTSHSASVGGLSANTLYHYRVKSRDRAGNLATSGDFSFTTAAGGGSGVRTFYLAPPSLGGSDSHDCTEAQNVATPKATIGAALACMSGGDRLEIRGATYEMPANAIAPPSGSSWTNATVITNYQGETVRFVKSANTDPVVFLNSQRSYIIFKGSAPYKLVFDANHFNNNAVKITSSQDGVAPPNHIRFENCEMKNAVYSGCLSSHRNTANEGSLEFIRCHIHHNGTRDNLDHGIYMNVPNVLVEYCDVHDNAAYGLQWDNGPTAGAMCRFNRVYNNGVVGGGGIVIYSFGESGHTVYNNVVYNNGGGYAIIIRTTGATVYNNTCWDVSGAHGQIYLWGENGGFFRNNICGSLFLDNSPNNYLENNLVRASSIVLAGDGTTGNILNNNILSGDPLFVNAGGFDYHLQSGSQAKDHGQNVSSIVNTDFDGNPRPMGPAFDIGAYEAVQTTAANLYKGTDTSGDYDVGKRVRSRSILFTRGSVAIVEPQRRQTEYFLDNSANTTVENNAIVDGNTVIAGSRFDRNDPEQQPYQCDKPDVRECRRAELPFAAG